MPNSQCLDYVCVALDLDTTGCIHVESYCADMAALGRDDYAECIADYVDYNLVYGDLQLDGSNNCFQSLEACQSICNPTRAVSPPTTSSTRPTVINNAKNTTATISYQKNINIAYNPNYGLGINTGVDSEYRYSMTINESTSVNPLVSTGKLANFSNNTKNTGTNRTQSIASDRQTVVQKDRINIGKAIQNNAINTLTGKFKPESIPIIDEKIISLDNSKNRNSSTIVFSKPQKPSIINTTNQSTTIQNQNINDLQYTWDWFTGNGVEYLPPPATFYDTCSIDEWVCVQDI